MEQTKRQQVLGYHRHRHRIASRNLPNLLALHCIATSTEKQAREHGFAKEPFASLSLSLSSRIVSLRLRIVNFCEPLSYVRVCDFWMRNNNEKEGVRVCVFWMKKIAT
jgi:hypothetical protein